MFASHYGRNCRYHDLPAARPSTQSGMSEPCLRLDRRLPVLLSIVRTARKAMDQRFVDIDVDPAILRPNNEIA